MDALAPQPLGSDVLRDKYAQPGERCVDVRRRIARALAQAEPPSRRDEWEARFLQAQQAGFVGSGATTVARSHGAHRGRHLSLA
jgi:ribonucleoside-diphosphate reductase alpha chain